MSEQAQRLLEAIQKHYKVNGDWFTASGVGGKTALYVDKSAWEELVEAGYIKVVDVYTYQRIK